MSDEQQLGRLEAQAEPADDKMYDATNSTDAVARHSDAKEAFHDAIALRAESGGPRTRPGSRRGLPTSRRCSGPSLVERGQSFPRLAANHRLSGGNRSMARNAARDTMRPMALSVVVCSIARNDSRTALNP
jgi:hypothetical protein